MTPILERKLIRQAQRGDNDARMALIRQHTPFLWRVARRVRSRGETPEDLWQIAAMEFLKAIDRFNLRLGLRLSTYVYRIVWQKCCQAGNESNVVRVPHNASARNQDKVYAAKFQYDGLPQDKLETILDWREPERVDEDGLLLKLRRAIQQLDERQRELIHDRLAGLTLSQIGAKMHVTRERVRQIEAKARLRIVEAMLHA